jgi:hypothetical protein
MGALLALAPAEPASAYIRIDDFRDPQSLVLAGEEDLASDAQIAPSVAGGERDASLTRLAGDGAVSVDIDPGGISLLLLENDVGVQSTLALVYDGADGDPLALDPSGLGSVDLTELGTVDRFAVRLQSDQAATLFVQIFDASDASGDTWSSGSLPVPAGLSLAWVELPLSDLDTSGPGGAADLTRIGAVLVGVTGPPGLDVQMGEIRVPEPGPAAGGLAALLSLAALRRRAR